VKVFNWVATMWRGSVTFETPMLFAVGFISVFSIGGLSGVILSVVPVDVQVHDTYYVIAHFHYVLVAGTLFAMFAGFYYWAPKWTGVMYDERRGRWHFWLSIVSFNLTFFPMHFLGLAGMPRRYADYPMQFADFNAVVSVSAFVFGLAQAWFALFIVWPMLRKRGLPAPARPWEGAQGLEVDPAHTAACPHFRNASRSPEPPDALRHEVSFLTAGMGFAVWSHSSTEQGG